MQDVDGYEVSTDELPPLEIEEKEFATAGLWERGWYEFNIESVKRADKEGKHGPYTVLTFVFRAAQKAIYDKVTGDHVSNETLDPQPIKWDDFPTSKSGAGKLNSIYKAITGRMPQGQEREDLDGKTRCYVNLEETAKQLVKASVWGNIYWKQGDDEIWRDKVGWNFKKKPPARFGGQR